jgi:prepilin-type N-terminal cleavage/methylation domain-containing protein
MKRDGFTLIELVMVLTVVFILAAVGAWRISGMREEARTVAQSDALATVQRMQALADMEGLQVTADDTLGRVLELQARLASKAHYYYQINPTNLAAQVAYDPTTQQWKKP